MKVARLNKPFGNGGALVATLYDAFPERPDLTAPLWAEIDGLRVPLFVASFERRGRTQAVMSFEDIDTPRRAAALLGKELSLGEMTAAPSSPADDLTGFAAIIDGLAQRAEVTGVFDGPNPLLELVLGGKTIWVPFADEFIKKIDRAKKELSLSLPRGLLELND